MEINQSSSPLIQSTSPVHRLYTAKKFGIFIKSAVVQKNLKLGVMNRLLTLKKFIATATCLEGVDLLTLAVESVYINTGVSPHINHSYKKKAVPMYVCE